MDRFEEEIRWRLEKGFSIKKGSIAHLLSVIDTERKRMERAGDAVRCQLETLEILEQLRDHICSTPKKQS